MLKRIEEYGKYVEIAGFKNVRIENVESFMKKISDNGLHDKVQFFDAKFVATWEHIYFAVVNALTAFKNKENVSKSLTMEILRYASAQRQIRKAIELVGVKQSSSDVAVLIVEKDREAAESTLNSISTLVGNQRDDSVLELSKDKTDAIQRAFEISATELETQSKKNGLERALVDCVIERMALLSTLR